jgi:hypothetical protein
MGRQPIREEEQRQQSATGGRGGGRPRRQGNLEADVQVGEPKTTISHGGGGGDLAATPREGRREPI